MLKRLKNLLIGVTFSFLVAAPFATAALPAVASAEGEATCTTRFLLGIPAWYRGLTKSDTDCDIKEPDNISNFIWKIVLNIIEAALVIVGYIAIFFILYGGFNFIVAGSTAARVEKARKTILNAVIGLAISIGSIAITNLIFGVI